MADIYKIFALKYAGPLSSSGAFTMWLKDWNKQVERNYYFWCCVSGNHTILVDAGVAPTHPKIFELPNYESPSVVLQRLNIRTNTVKHVILTHLHWDHSSGIELFPNATFYLQRTEYDFWINNTISKTPLFNYLADTSSQKYLEKLAKLSRLVLLDGDKEILPNIKCLKSPGHSVGMQAVSVETELGTAVLGSDCGHTFRNYIDNWPSCIFTNLVEWLASIQKITSKANSIELVFPGHDILMERKYERIANGITRLA